uniref:Glycosyl hydrolases family 38 C-terminal domain-containing protein n=1 Tax=Anaerolinea thermolimosa TaxID=229919 RepID=A0A7C4KFT8_9CHLR
MPTEAGFLRVQGGVVLTSLRQTDAGLEVRLFNPETRVERATLCFTGLPAGSEKTLHAQRVDFDHRPLGDELKIEEGQLSISIKPKEIVTLALAGI